MAAVGATIPTRTLILAMVDSDGALDAGRLFEIAGACGMSDEQVRLCLRRLVAEGSIEHLGGRGRRARFRLSEGAESRVLPEAGFLDFALRQDAGLAPWDGTWRLVGFAIPETRRRQRDELRRRLLFLGGGSIYGGLYISPNPWEELVRATAIALDVLDDLTIARTGELTVGDAVEPRQVAERVWPLTEVRCGYQEFLETLQPRLTALDADGGDWDRVVRDAFLTITDFSRAITPDPLLPPELLPEDWPGQHARRLLLDAFRRFSAVIGDEHFPPGLRSLLGLSA